MRHGGGGSVVHRGRHQRHDRHERQQPAQRQDEPGVELRPDEDLLRPAVAAGQAGGVAELGEGGALGLGLGDAGGGALLDHVGQESFELCGDVVALVGGHAADDLVDVPVGEGGHDGSFPRRVMLSVSRSQSSLSSATIASPSGVVR